MIDMFYSKQVYQQRDLHNCVTFFVNEDTP